MEPWKATVRRGGEGRGGEEPWCGGGDGLKASCDRTECEPALADGLAGQMF